MKKNYKNYYNKDYYLENREKYLARAKKRYEEKREELIAYAKNYYENNQDKVKKYNQRDYVKKKNIQNSHEYYHKNNEKIKAKRKIKRATSKYKENFKKYFEKYAKENKGRLNFLKKMYKLAKRNSTPKWLTDEQKDQIRNFYIQAADISEQTGIQHQVDHIVPLRGKTISGLHVPWNLRVIPWYDNRSKTNKLLVDLLDKL